MALPTYRAPDDTECNVIGWGSIYSGGSYPPILREVVLPVIGQGGSYIHRETL